MSCRLSRAWTPVASASCARGLSSDLSFRVSPGSMSFKRKPLPSVTRKGLASSRASLKNSFISSSPSASVLTLFHHHSFRLRTNESNSDPSCHICRYLDLYHIGYKLSISHTKVPDSHTPVG